MSSDIYSSGGLSPDYNVQWKTLFQQVIRLILYESVILSTWQEREMAVIKIKGCTLGQVVSIESDATWSDKQHIRVSRYASEWCKNTANIFWTLTLQTLADSIQEGDIICLLQGASKPTIIRSYKDYFIIVAIAINPAVDEQAEKMKNSWVKVLQSVTDFPRDLLLVWDWTKSLSENGEDDEYLLSSPIFKDEITTHLVESGLIMSDLRRFKLAAEILKRVVEKHSRQLKGERSHAIAAMTNLATAYKDMGFPEEGRNWETMAGILSGNKGTERMVLGLLWRSYDREIRLHPDWRSQATTTEEIFKHTGIASSKDVMALLLDWSDDQIIITEDIAKAAAGNLDLMELLLDRRGNQIAITEDIVKAAARNLDLMKLLLDRRGDQITITEDIVKIAAGEDNGVMELLLDRRGNQIAITEDVVKAAARGFGSTMEVLLDRRGDQITITEEIVTTAARSNKRMMEILLDRRGDEITITDTIVRATAEDYWGGEGTMELLLDRRGDEITITEDIIREIAAKNNEVMEVLLSRRGDQIIITEDIVKAAAGNEWIMKK
jgi:hypothetical protein